MSRVKLKWFEWGSLAHAPEDAIAEPTAGRPGRSLCGLTIPAKAKDADFLVERCDTCTRLSSDAEDRASVAKFKKDRAEEEAERRVASKGRSRNE